MPFEVVHEDGSVPRSERHSLLEEDSEKRGLGEEIGQISFPLRRQGSLYSETGCGDGRAGRHPFFDGDNREHGMVKAACQSALPLGRE